MKTEPEYFQTTINASSAKELAARIADNELRGFELVTSVTTESSDGHATNSSYIDSQGRRVRYRIDSTIRKFQAVMRRENRKFKAIDEELIGRFELS